MKIFMVLEYCIFKRIKLNIPLYWFINKTNKKQKYCNLIYENNMTCNEIAKKERANKNEKDDIYLQKCRKNSVNPPNFQKSLDNFFPLCYHGITTQKQT